MLGLSTVLVACGGGGSSSGSSATSNSIAEGAWSGFDSSGASFDLLVLENGDLYSVFGTISGGALLVQGFVQGSSRMNGNALSANITQYAFNSTETGTIDATVVPGVSIKGVATNSAGTTRVTISASPITAVPSGYNYNSTPVLADVTGSWTGSVLGSDTATIRIDSAGSVSGNEGGCSFTGNAVARSSGKNVFNIALTFGPSPCTAPGQSLSGIAVNYALYDGNRQLLAFLQDRTKAQGYLFFAQR